MGGASDFEGGAPTFFGSKHLVGTKTESTRTSMVFWTLLEKFSQANADGLYIFACIKNEWNWSWHVLIIQYIFTLFIYPTVIEDRLEAKLVIGTSMSSS